MLLFLDYFLTGFHLSFVLFVLVGWYWQKTRPYHKWALLLTTVAWLILGWYVGTIGYCPLTDWHWDIKRSLGEKNIPSSFIEYLLEKWTNVDFNKKLVDTFTALGLVFGVTMAILKEVTARRLNKRKSKERLTI
ncbi:MAG: DUF2784 domain-containing protein [Cyclobacteriaceae bacterium]